MLFAFLFVRPAAGQALPILYVTPTGTGDCAAWASACHLQAALTAAQPGSEIWVAAGTYTPTSGTDRTARFTLKEGVAMYGGFSGVETSRDERRWSENVTTLSGEIGALNNPSDNSLHVLYASGLSSKTVLDGFTITAGNANLTGQDPNLISPNAVGSGLYLLNSSPTLTHVTFSANHAAAYGGAVFMDKGALVLNDSSFLDNSSDSIGGAVYLNAGSLNITGGQALRNNSTGSGGAIYGHGTLQVSNFTFADNHAGTGGALFLSYNATTLTQVTFTGNVSSGYGGAIYNYGSYTSSLKITNTTFGGNRASEQGGAINDSGISTVITNTIFYQNHTDADGGAIYSSSGKTTRIINSTFYQNSAGDSGGAILLLYCPVIRNSIIWGNTANMNPQIYDKSCPIDLANSTVQDWPNDPAKKIYSFDPLFASTQNGAIDLRLTPASPAINQGDALQLTENTLTDLDGNPRIQGTAVDLGAYEQQKFNHAPVLNTALFNLPAIDEDQADGNGSLVSDLIQDAASDADGDIPGILVTAVDTAHGKWLYQNQPAAEWVVLFPSGVTCCRLLGPNARIRFTPSPDWNGTLTSGLTFRLWDQADGQKSGDLTAGYIPNLANSAFSSQQGSLSIIVRPVNDPPVNSQPPYITGAPIPADQLSANPGAWQDVKDSPASQYTYAFQWQSSASDSGPWSDIPGASGASFTLPESNLGQFIRVVVTASDDGVGQPPAMSTSAASVPLQVVSTLDVIVEGDTALVTMDEDSRPQAFNLTLHYPPNLVPTWRVSAPPGHGTASVNSLGKVSYAPSPNYNGIDQFDVSAQIGTVVDTLTVNVSIRAINDPPVNTVSPSLLNPAVYQKTLVTDPGQWNDNLDLVPGALTFTYQWQISPNVYGTWSNLTGETALYYTPRAEDVGRYLRLLVTVTDDGEGQPPSTGTWAATAPGQVTNAAPIIAEGAVLDVTGAPVQLHASDADGHALFWFISRQPSHGQVSVDKLGQVSIALLPNCAGMDDFTVTVSDGQASDTILLRPPAGSCRFYVDDSASKGQNNSSTWENAFTDLQSALAAARPGDEIWVAAGLYKPTSGTDRAISFALKRDVKLYGGFAGSETRLEERDWQRNITVLSGEIGIQGTFTDNSFHVVSANDLSSTTVLDGFTITAGYAGNVTITADYNGGGMVNTNSSPTLANLIFSENYGSRGPGMYNDHSSPTMTNLIFSQNHGGNGPGMFNYYSNPTMTNLTFSQNYGDSGGGMFNYNSSPILIDSVFRENQAGTGGAIANEQSSGTFINVAFLGNQSIKFGGAMNNAYTSSPSLVNVLFYGNSAGENGGAIYNSYTSSPQLINATFYLNQAKVSGAISSDSNSQPKLYNCILWNDVATITNPEVNKGVFDHCIVQGMANNPATGVYGDEAHNPRFVDAPHSDFHLQGGSPAVNGGSNAWLPADLYDLDQDGNTAEPLPLDLGRSARVDGGGTVDLGAYEFIDLYAPSAVADTYPAFDEDSDAQTLDVLANDSDPDGGPLTITSVTQGSLGDVTFTTTQVIYTPHHDANGPDTFTYTVTDGSGHTATANVSLVIQAVNDLPTLSSLGDRVMAANTSLTLPFTIGDIETPTGQLVVSVESSDPALVPAAGLVLGGTGEDRTLTLTPAKGRSGTVTLTITVTDADGAAVTTHFHLDVKTDLTPLFLPLIQR